MLKRAGTWAHHNPFLLLVLTAMMWAGNGVAARLAVDHISPMALTSLRWIVTCAAMAAFAWRPVVEAWPQLKPRIGYLVVMGTIGFNGFNVPFYWGAHHTSAVNLTIIQGSIPVFVMLGALALYGTPITGLQALGMTVTLVGVAVLASQGEIAHLIGLDFNVGDLGMILACLLYAGYTIGLRSRPTVSGLALLGALAVVAAVTSVPLVVIEAASGDLMWPDATGLLIVLYVGLLPSLTAQMLFIRAVELIGPGRASLFVNLVPVFGALFAVAILAEPFGVYHAAALALVLGGIALAELRR
ncbi:DMT family transporter [Blastochloris viridis]|uniref:Permease of the drug/metabolite transporter superfamily n=1 Tax=Blastochloris viridis TaxID=1079 RepID=A0A182D3I8_BLAVI|nr:DMT family transporter [Blastochloris viridis]ALK10574.1 EamA-like transporter family protein [Blastochloris viridis]BAR99471.1 permease of the drug/metabolite transporter superfamily [Blastochloris viridis]